jgi:hypothetical protein
MLNAINALRTSYAAICDLVGASWRAAVLVDFDGREKILVLDFA